MSDFLEILAEALETPSGWAGFSAPAGNLLPRLGPVSWPYRTATAEKVWDAAKQIIPRYPHLNEREALKKAVEDAGANPLDLTPEDWRLLEMAVEWFKNGFTGVSTPRIGGGPGSPGGPFNTASASGYLPRSR